MKYNTAAGCSEKDQQAFVFDVGSLYCFLEAIDDKRDPRGVRYPLVVILVFIILAKLAGENHTRGIAHWISLRKDLLLGALNLDRKSVPHHTTYARVMGNALDGEQLQNQVSSFLTSPPEAGRSVIVNLDGKTLRGTIPANQTQGVHLLAAYLRDEGIVPVQVEVGSKENEISAAPRVLKSIDLRGKIVTGDAMFAQRELSAQIVEAGGDYLWAVKDNQPALKESIEACFAIEEGRTRLKTLPHDFDRAESLDKAHGRIERRRIVATSLLQGTDEWPYLEQVFRVEREVEELSTGKKRQEIAYGVTSLSRKQAGAKSILAIGRGHWGIENGLHYRKDKTLKEDECRLRTGAAAQVMAVINNLIVGLVLRQGLKNLPEARRTYNARLLEALDLILRS